MNGSSRNIRLWIQFDGTEFHGWQQQGTLRTVQSVLADAIGTMIGERPVVQSSSRTDAGVHAMAMPVNFHCDKDLPLKAFWLGLNALLPPDLRVIRAEEVDTDFNARFEAVRKTYWYRVLSGRVALPLDRRNAWFVPEKSLDLGAMRTAARCLVGEHDFSSFRAALCDAASPVRRLYRLDIVAERPDLCRIEVEGSGFLRNMVRILAGTLVAVGRGRFPAEWVGEVLTARDRRLAGQTAPPHGLTLIEVMYPPPGTTRQDFWQVARLRIEEHGPLNDV